MLRDSGHEMRQALDRRTAGDAMAEEDALGLVDHGVIAARDGSIVYARSGGGRRAAFEAAETISLVAAGGSPRPETATPISSTPGAKSCASMSSSCASRRSYEVDSPAGGRNRLDE